MFAATALAATSITVTFVRHAESQANADGIIDTKVPGPHLSNPVGVAQAQAIADALAGNGYDGIYASDMYRTQETAQPLADLLHKTITVLPGLHEIDAGVYEGSSEDDGWGRLGYAATPLLWTLGLRFATMPGSTDSDGNVFQHRVADAIQDIYDSGNQNPVVFSHGATIMFWTLMNVDNPDLFLLFTHPLNNTSVVVINGNPDDGWKLVSWDGVSVAAEPSLLMKLFVDVRDLIVAPQEAVYTVSHAFDSGNLFEAADALIKAAVKLGLSPIDFVVSVAKHLIDEIFKPATTSGVSTAAVEAAPEPAARLAAVPEPVSADVTPSVATPLAVTSGTTVAEAEPATATATAEPSPAAVEQTESAAPATTEATTAEVTEEVTDQDQTEAEETATPATDTEAAEDTAANETEATETDTEAADADADAAADDDVATKDDQSESDATSPSKSASTPAEDTTANETHSTAATSDATDHTQDAAA